MAILKSDNRAAAVERGAEFVDDQLTYFWDGDRLNGKVWRRALGLRGLAWDLYLLYDAESEWKTLPVVPEFWMHQLGLARGKAPFLDQAALEKRVRRLLRKVK